MLDSVINLAILTGAGLCVSLLAYGSCQVVKFLFEREGLRRVLARIADHESAHLDQYVE